MREGNVLLATYPCGCWGMVHVLPAEADHLADFYKQVAKYNKAATKANKPHRMLAVVEVAKPEWTTKRIECELCKPPKKAKAVKA